ncbi:VOC family protein [Croceicoccus bisphenolivorans]|uniref:VOC family protein n=1 Tax=Croceicoccus bisphenolivorans TaxID=1783232 RepID=UPI00083562B8|nr:VOC family protein [Croceicoccus bisphenolivorans]
MRVETLDHVNIVTGDLAGTVSFYRDVLGLEQRDPPEPLQPDLVQWLCDAGGRPIFHLVDRARMDRKGPYANKLGGQTGSVDHVALNCTGLEEMRARLDARGLDYRVGGVSGISLVQVFVRDPNNVLLELNFREG